MNGVDSYRHIRRGIELGFSAGRPLVYDGTEPVAIDAQAGKGKLARFLGVNLVSPRTAHLTKIITDPKDAELAWVSWKTLERQGYKVRFLNAGRLYGYPSETYNFNTRLLEVAAKPELRSIVGEVAYDCASYLVPVDPNPAHRWIGQGVRTAFALKRQSGNGRGYIMTSGITVEKCMGLKKPGIRRVTINTKRLSFIWIFRIEKRN